MRKWLTLCSVLCLFVLLFIPVSAAGYAIDAPAAVEYANATSVEPVITADRGDLPNEDLSKSSALIPPPFGSPTSYLLGSGAPLTPNLTNVGIVTGTASPLLLSNIPYDSITWEVTPMPSYTAVTSDLYYSKGYLGTLKIPSLGVNVKVYQGTDNAQLAKGAGHFEETSIWDGNVCIAGHNRGTNCYFGEIHTLSAGERITFSAKMGTRTYAVTSITKISETDHSMLASTSDNRITLITCVRNQSAYRWCIQAVEIV